MFNNERVSILVRINKVLSRLGCWVMKELDNKGINVSGFQEFGLSKHKISWIEYISNSVQRLVFSLYVFVE